MTIDKEKKILEAMDYSPEELRQYLKDLKKQDKSEKGKDGNVRTWITVLEEALIRLRGEL